MQHQKAAAETYELYIQERRLTMMSEKGSAFNPLAKLKTLNPKQGGAFNSLAKPIIASKPVSNPKAGAVIFFLFPGLEQPQPAR
jgi:hypothetical protein